jgi:hypothetical protein
MPRRFRGPAIFAVAVVLIVAGAYWLSRPRATHAGSDKPPAGAPAPASCWTVDETAAKQAFPWPGNAVDCAGPHTAEVYHVGQVDPQLVDKLAQAKGDDAVLQQNLMYAQARRACTVLATSYLGGLWHTARVQVIADWIKPTTSGHFGCALVETADPAGTRFARRTGSVRDALKAGESAALLAGCVARGGDGALAYAACDQPHDGEFVGAYTITPPDAPFDEKAVRSAADRGCVQAALTYLGLPADANRADLRPGYVGPTTAGDWLGSDQTFACYVLATEGRLRGSVKGLGTRAVPRP